MTATNFSMQDRLHTLPARDADNQCLGACSATYAQCNSMPPVPARINLVNHAILSKPTFSAAAYSMHAHPSRSAAGRLHACLLFDL